jgi:hypothetical protein
MKRTATILGVAAALAVPSVASAASKPHEAVMAKPQVAKVMVAKVAVAKVAVAGVQVSRVHVARAHVARTHVARAQVVRPLGTKIVLSRTKIAVLRIR